nr:unnamed protein product [Digitaria exilis]
MQPPAARIECTRCDANSCAKQRQAQLPTLEEELWRECRIARLEGPEVYGVVACAAQQEDGSSVAFYWNSRLATERQRLVNDIFRDSDVVCDMFSGVGPLAISAAKKVKYVYANDINPMAVEYLERNTVLNKLERKIELGVYIAYKDVFRGILHGSQSGLRCVMPTIHVYGFSKAEDPEHDLHERINIALGENVDNVEMHRVRLVAPGKWMICASFTLPESVAIAQPNYISC